MESWRALRRTSGHPQRVHLHAQNLSPALITSKSCHVQVIQKILLFSVSSMAMKAELLNEELGFAHTSCSIKCPNEPSNLQTVFLIGQFRRVAISLLIIRLFPIKLLNPVVSSFVFNMALLAAKNWRAYYQLWPIFLRFSSSSVATSPELLEESVKMAVAAKSYEQIPDLLQSKEESCKAKNPFSFLSAFTLSYRTEVVDEMLQSFIPLKPHSRLKNTYHYLLTYTLQSSEPFPLALATLQRTLRSGCTPVPQTHLLLSSAWIDHRSHSRSVPSILLEMKSIGYHPDSGTCNFVITSLCAVNQLEEAVEVIGGMVKTACIPDVESYCTVIAAFSALRKTEKAVTLLKEMVGKLNISPRQGTLVKLAASLRANKEIWRAAEMIEFLEQKGFHVGFECYELVVEGCLECREFILAGKMAMLMTDKGYIPYIKVRQKVVEGLAEVGEWKLACAVRHKFAELNS